MNSFVTTALLCLAPAARRERTASSAPLSIKKLAGVLKSRNYASVIGSSTSRQTKDQLQKQKHPKPKPHMNSKKVPTSPTKVKTTEAKRKQPALKLRTSSLSEEENKWVSHIESARRLYATALVCVSEISYIGCLNGLVPMHANRPFLRQHMIANVLTPEDHRAAQARNVLVLLLAALGNELGMNRYPLMPTGNPTMKIKITVEGEVVKKEEATNKGPADSQRQLAIVAASAAEPLPKPPPSVGSSSAASAPAGLPLVANESTRAPLSVYPTTFAPSSAAGTARGCNTLGNPPERVIFSREDFEGDDALSRGFFGKPGRMLPCLRCQANKRSMIFCRVTMAHSNIDFDLATHFPPGRGLDGLFRTLLKQPEPPTPKPAITPLTIKSEKPEAESASASKSTTVKDENKAQVDTGKHGNAQEHKLSSGKDDSTVAKGDENASQQPQHNNSPASDSLKAEDVDSTSEAKEDIDPRDMYQKATSAIKRANELLAAAKRYTEAPPRLSFEFIKEEVPVDPDDGMYELCLVCGLSGNLLICESCPNVVHPKCAGLDKIPQGDWYCGLCNGHCNKAGDTVPTAETASSADVDLEAQSAARPEEPVEASKACAGEGTGLDSRAAKAAETRPHEEGRAHDNLQGESARPPGVTVGTIPPIVTYDEEKATELTKDLEELFVLRTGRKRGVGGPKSDAAVDVTQPESEAAKAIPESLPKDAPKEAKLPLAAGPQEDRPQIALHEEKLQIGTCLKKKFGRKFYAGSVTTLPTEDHPYFGVTYEDGDKEDLTKEELLELLRAEKAPKKKRGRPRKNENGAKTAEEQSNKKVKGLSPKSAQNGITKANGLAQKRKRVDDEADEAAKSPKKPTTNNQAVSKSSSEVDQLDVSQTNDCKANGP